jgi:hypothetical protein
MLAVTTNSRVCTARGSESTRRSYRRDVRDRHVLQQDRELVAAQARHGVFGAQAGAQPSRHFAQGRVAGGVPERVVDQLEAVEVEEQHGQHALRAAAARDGVGQALGEQEAVGQLGQRVVVGQVLQALLHLHAFVDVRADGHEVRDRPVGRGQRRDDLLFVAERAVLALVDEHVTEDLAAQDGLPQARVERLIVASGLE